MARASGKRRAWAVMCSWTRGRIKRARTKDSPSGIHPERRKRILNPGSTERANDARSRRSDDAFKKQ